MTDAEIRAALTETPEQRRRRELTFFDPKCSCGVYREKKEASDDGR